MNGHKINDHEIETKIYSINKFHKESSDFVPADLGYDEQPLNIDRKPPLPMWYVASYKEGRESIIEAAQVIQRKVGKISFENLKRYGKNILIKASDEVQAELLTRFKTPASGNIKAISPHKTFNTPKGVIYSRDLAMFSEDQILNMCPPNVFQVKRMRGVNNAILLTFSSTYVPDYITFDHLRVRVKKYRARPTQCYNCLEYGHIISRCFNLKKCNVCSQQHQEWGACEQPPYCFHCTGTHSPTSKECPRNRFEQEVVDTAQNQHISIGSAKRQVMAANRDPCSSYALAIKKMKSSNPIRKQNHYHNKTKDDVPLLIPTSEVAGSSFDKSEKAADMTDKVDLDSLPSLESAETEADNDKSGSQSITLETNSSVITVTKKNQQENQGFTAPSRKKRARPTSPKDNSKVQTSNKFTALEESPTSKKKALSKEKISPINTAELSEKPLTNKESISKEQKSSKPDESNQVSKESSITECNGAKNKNSLLPNNSTSRNRKKLSTENFSAHSREKASHPGKDRIGNKS